MALNPNPAVKADILRELRRIAGTVETRKGKREFGRVSLLVEKIFDPKTPSYQLSIMGMASEFIKHGFHVPGTEMGAYSGLIVRLQQVLIGLGYREDISTYQEHTALGSTTGNYAKTPYTPIGVLEGKLTIEDARQARILEVTTAVFAANYGLNGGVGYTHVSLEQLDDAGNSVRDPRPVDVGKLPAAYRAFRAGHMTFGQMLDACAIPAQRAPDFPFRRD